MVILLCIMAYAYALRINSDIMVFQITIAYNNASRKIYRYICFVSHAALKKSKGPCVHLHSSWQQLRNINGRRAYEFMTRKYAILEDIIE